MIMKSTRGRALLGSLLLSYFALFSSAEESVVNVRRRLSTNATATAAVENANEPGGADVGQALLDRHMQATWWKPKASDLLSWQWTLQGPIDTTLNVDVFDVDLFDTPVSTIQALKAKGVKVICYFSAGTYEGWRSDWKKFFPFITGASYTGTRAPFAGNMADWDERWLDIRRIDLLRPIMTSRIKLAVTKGCDAVEPDNMDAYANLDEVNKPLTAAHQLAYNKFIANTAHSLGMSVGLKNDLGQLSQLVSFYDFAVNEQCFYYQECSGYTSTFVKADKAVFGAEYQGDPAVFCPTANQMKLSFQKKTLALKQWRIGCENY
jgi:hypothetical protein